jgi:hypothetical protein
MEGSDMGRGYPAPRTDAPTGVSGLREDGRTSGHAGLSGGQLNQTVDMSPLQRNFQNSDPSETYITQTINAGPVDDVEANAPGEPNDANPSDKYLAQARASYGRK